MTRPKYIDLPRQFTGCFAKGCVECGKSPVRRWWLGKVELGPEETYVVAADCGGCSEAIREAYLKSHRGARTCRELSLEEVEVMRTMCS